MAAALLQAHAVRSGAPLEVSSAGLGPDGFAAEPAAIDAMAELGFELGSHRSRQLSAELLAESGLVLVMTKQHAIETVLLSPEAWPRTFTLVDLVGRARRIGPPVGSESLKMWVERAHGGRSRASVMSLPGTDDIADPVGQPLEEHVRTRNILDRLTGELVTSLAPTTPQGPSARNDADR
jgi:protein-tyrosine phosphatase